MNMTKAPPKSEIPVFRRGFPYRDITLDEIKKSRSTPMGMADMAKNALTNYGKMFFGGGKGAKINSSTARRHPMNEKAMVMAKKKMMGKGGCGPKKK